MAPPTGAHALKGPSPPQKLPPPRSPDVTALSRRSAARSRVFVSAPRVAPVLQQRRPCGPRGPCASSVPGWKGLAGPGRTAHAHSITVPSADPAAKVRPSGLAATEQTAEVWPWRVARH